MTVRSLADALRAADDERLGRLFRARPDLLQPVPVDIAQLALRASSAPAVARLMDHLDRWTLDVLEVACVPAEPTAEAVAALLPAVERARVDDTLDRLADLALVWTDDEDELHVVVGAREVVGPAPADLGPPLAVALAALGPQRLEALAEDHGRADGWAADPEGRLAAHLAEPATLDALLAGAPEQARELLAQLTWGPPVGKVPRADRDVRTATAGSPVEWLLARGLLVAADRTTVVLPREVGLHLRGGTAVADARPDPPRPAPTATTEPARADRTGAAQAFGIVRLVDDLLDAWSVDPPAVLRAGGLGVRELRRAAERLELEEWEAALVAELARAAGLLTTSGSFDEEYVPTPAYDRWRAEPVAERWLALARAWLAATRAYGLVGTRDERDRAVAALGPDVERLAAPELRRGVLDVLADAAPGAVLAVSDVEDVLGWHRPRRSPRLRRDSVVWTVREADRLGVTGAGALTTAGRALLSDDPAAAADAVEPLLPQPVDHVLLQADLTAVAPGPLVSDLAHELALAADVESRGGATVYRFTEASVRRALDAGRSAADLHRLLETRSRTPVPQPLTYLVDDVARRHGAIRVGLTGAYVRCDDPAVIDELVAHRRASGLALRRIAPTVAVAQGSVDDVLEGLRAMGYAPAAESPDGAVLVRRPDARRAPARTGPTAVRTPAPSDVLVSAAVRALRAGERASKVTRSDVVAGMAAVPDRAATAVLPRTAATRTIDLLRSALTEGRPVWIGYVDTHGGVSERVVDPVRLDGGVLTAYDHRLEQVRTFPVHRITGVAALDDD
jgi:hypothetical protein